MSKFLKVIVNLVVLFSIVIAAALLVPPFIGIDTVMNDNLNTETNLPVGSVAYGEEIKIKDLKKKDKIIYTEGSSEYIYEIVALGAEEGEYEVKDPYRKGSDTEVVTLQKAVPKVVVVVPFIGYVAIALQTKEGLIVVGLGIVFLIILFILSELWRKDDDDDDDDEYEDEEEYEDDEDEEEELSRKERRRLKKEEKRRRKEEKRRQKEEDDEEYEDEDEEEEEVLTRKEKRRLKKEEKRRRKLQKKGLLAEEEEEEESELLKPVEVPQNTQQDEELQGFDEAMKEAMSSIALGITESSEETSETVAVMDESIEEAEMIEEKLLQEEKEVQEEEPVSSIEKVAEEKVAEEKVAEEKVQPEVVEAIPVNVDAIPKTPTIQELLDQVQAAGETPEVKKDKENKITLLDYSDIL